METTFFKEVRTALMAALVLCLAIAVIGGAL